MQVDVGPVLSAAQMVATLARLDDGPGFVRIRIYSTAIPETPGSHSDTPQATFTLPKPCGAVVAGVLVFAAPPQAMVMSDGLPRWGEVLAADGAFMWQADATDKDHDGFFQLEGAPTPDGETSPMYYAGGMVTLGTTAVT